MPARTGFDVLHKVIVGSLIAASVYSGSVLAANMYGIYSRSQQRKAATEKLLEEEVVMFDEDGAHIEHAAPALAAEGEQAR